MYITVRRVRDEPCRSGVLKMIKFRAREFSEFTAFLINVCFSSSGALSLDICSDFSYCTFASIFFLSLSLYPHALLLSRCSIVSVWSLGPFVRWVWPGSVDEDEVVCAETLVGWRIETPSCGFLRVRVKRFVRSWKMAEKKRWPWRGTLKMLAEKRRLSLLMIPLMLLILRIPGSNASLISLVLVGTEHLWWVTRQSLSTRVVWFRTTISA